MGARSSPLTSARESPPGWITPGQRTRNGTFEPGEHRYDLAAEGVGYATSGGFVDDIVPQLEEAKAAIIAGTVTVPVDPTQA